MANSRMFVGQLTNGATQGYMSVSITGLGPNGTDNIGLNIYFMTTTTATDTAKAIAAAILASPAAVSSGLQVALYLETFLIFIPDTGPSSINISFGNALGPIVGVRMNNQVTHSMPTLDGRIASLTSENAALTSEKAALAAEVEAQSSEIIAKTAEIAALSAGSGSGGGGGATTVNVTAPVGQAGSSGAEVASVAFLAFGAGLALGNSPARAEPPKVRLPRKTVEVN